MLSHDSIYAFTYVNFQMVQQHKYSLGDVENMLPFERRLFVELIVKALEEEKKAMENK